MKLSKNILEEINKDKHANEEYLNKRLNELYDEILTLAYEAAHMGKFNLSKKLENILGILDFTSVNESVVKNLKELDNSLKGKLDRDEDYVWTEKTSQFKDINDFRNYLDDFFMKDIDIPFNIFDYEYVIIDSDEKVVEPLIEGKKLKEDFWNPGKYFKALQDMEDTDGDKWNKASQEERDKMVRPYLTNFWNKYKEEMTQADLDALFDDMEDSNYHTPLRILQDIINKDTKKKFKESYNKGGK